MAEKCHFPRAPAGKNKFIFRDEIMFDSDFDSGNLDAVVDCGSSDYNYEFNLWTALDCAGTPYENPNRTWFYFSIRGGIPGSKMLLNVVNLNKQCKLYQQGMSPVIKQVPGKCGWERMRDRPAISVGEFGMKLSFFHSVTLNHRAATYYAFCFPHSYSDCQKRLERIEAQLDTSIVHDSIYYHRELLTRSLDGRRIDLITISSNRGITRDREPRLSGICPSDEERPNIFLNKLVYFLSARVHPGEVTSSHLFNGFLDFILRPDDLRAKALRDLFVFKLVPLVNPDGVARGHYRVDQRGVNLNRMYLNPDPLLHPSVFAIKAVILHHHTRGVITSKKKLKSLGHSINRTPHTATDTSHEDMLPCSTTHEEILTPENEFTEHLLPELQMHKTFTGLWNDSSFSHLSIKSISEKDFNIM